ncbi:MAG: hypothetical protein AAFR75_06775 [Pseudomonadota bacterium]
MPELELEPALEPAPDFTSVALRSMVAYGFLDPVSPAGFAVSLPGGDFLSAMKKAVLYTPYQS